MENIDQFERLIAAVNRLAAAMEDANRPKAGSESGAVVSFRYENGLAVGAAGGGGGGGSSQP